MALFNLAVKARGHARRRDLYHFGGPRVGASRPPLEAASGPLVRLSGGTSKRHGEATLARAIEPFFPTKASERVRALGFPWCVDLRCNWTVGSRSPAHWARMVVDPLVSHQLRHGRRASRIVRGAAGRAGLGTAMLVDDEEMVRLSTADMLMDLGYEVVEASSGEERRPWTDR